MNNAKRFLQLQSCRILHLELLSMMQAEEHASGYTYHLTCLYHSALTIKQGLYAPDIARRHT